MRRKKKRRMISLTLIVTALLLILGCVGYLMLSNEQNKTNVSNESIEKIDTNDAKKSVETNKPDVEEESTPYEENSTNALFEKFLNGEIDADVVDDVEGTEYTLNVSELNLDGDDWDSSSVYGYLDVDNDGEDELIIIGPYGASFFDAVDGKVKRFAAGGGTADILLLAYYEDAYWVVHAYRSNDLNGCTMDKYNGADTIEETFYYGNETDENGKTRYYKDNGSGEEVDITEEEYKELTDTIIQFN